METKLADTKWTETQDPEFIKDLNAVKNLILNMVGELQTFMSIYYEYTRLIAENMMFIPGTPSESGNVEGMPTQTPAEPAPANRAERRARKTPLEVVNGTKQA